MTLNMDEVQEASASSTTVKKECYTMLHSEVYTPVIHLFSNLGVYQVNTHRAYNSYTHGVLYTSVFHHSMLYTLCIITVIHIL